MDKFNKNAIILLIAAVTALTIMAYVSYHYVDGAPSQLPSTDGNVNAKAGSTGTCITILSPSNIGEIRRIRWLHCSGKLWRFYSWLHLPNNIQ